MTVTYSQMVEENKVLYICNFSISLTLFQNKKIFLDVRKVLNTLKKQERKTKPDQVH